MSTLIRNFVGVFLVIGLSCVIGCSTTKDKQAGSKQTNIFPFPKVGQKKEERAIAGSMEEFIAKERVTTLKR